MNTNEHSDLLPRSLVGGGAVILITILVGLSSVSGLAFLFTLVLLLLVGGGSWEYYALLKAKGEAPPTWLGVIFSLLFVCAVDRCVRGDANGLFPLLTLGMMVLVLCTTLLFSKTKNLNHVALVLFGIIYIALPLSFMIPIRFSVDSDGGANGIAWIAYLICVTKMTDVVALFVGRNLGRHRLAPEISPGKTVEGGIGGVVGATGTSLVIAMLASWGLFGVAPFITYSQALWIGLLFGTVGQLGDLVESMFKRDANIKDSNRLPGLGGILDIVDSLLFTTPILYLIHHYII